MKFKDLLESSTATAEKDTPVYTEILSEEAIKYIEAVRKAAYDQGYFDGRMKGIEDMKNRIKSNLDLK